MTVHCFRRDADGRLHPVDTEAASLDDLSLALPDGIYTTFRTYHHYRVMGLSAHLARLVESHALMGDDRPLDIDGLRQSLRQVLATLDEEALRLRITTPYRSPDAYIAATVLTPWPERNYTEGVLCRTTTLPRDTPRAKYTGWIAPARSSRAQAAGAEDVHELLRVDAGGQFTEGLSSNVFFVHDGALVTADDGILDGVTRRLVLDLAPGIAPVRFARLPVSALPEVEEVFITSSTREVMPVHQIDDIVFGAPGPVTQALLTRYRQHILDTSEIV